jgi:predicted hotdog family 3-hydroxylacyl-ACP dehydratase
MSHNLDIRDLVPHEAPMVWLDELIEWRPGRARCRAVVHDTSPFVEDGALDAIMLLEHMAQAVAACLGYGALKSGESVRVGMVVACRAFDVGRPRIPAGSVLDVVAESVREVESVSNYACSVRVGEEEVASAELTLYHASEPPG